MGNLTLWYNSVARTRNKIADTTSAAAADDDNAVAVAAADI